MKKIRRERKIFWSAAALVSLSFVLPLQAAAEEQIFDGDQTALRGSSCVEYAGLSQGTGRGAGNSLRISPDKWHAAMLNIFCGAERFDWSGASFLTFYIRSEYSGAADKDFWVESWNGFSAKVPISKYIEGGRIESSWKQVVIPLSDLRTGSWNLNNVEKLFWGPDEMAGVYYIDDIIVGTGNTLAVQSSFLEQASASTPLVDPVVSFSSPVPVSAPVAQIQVSSSQTTVVSSSVKTPLSPIAGARFELLPVSNTVLRVIVPYKIDLESSKDVRNYELSSNTDTAYTSSKNPKTTGRITRVVGFEPNANYTLGKADKPLFESEIFLVFSEPLKENTSYTLTVRKIRGASGGGFAASESLGFVWATGAYVTGSVKTNQVGFLPKGPKYAYIGNYLGDAGALSVGASSCEVRNAENGSLVTTHTVRFRKDDTTLSGEKVYDCDFSSVEAPGKYFISVPGYGRTYDFSIQENVYDRLFSLEHRLFYYQRDGAALSSSHAGVWARGAGHTETDKNAVIHESHKNSPLYNNEPINGTLDMRGGWFDAGDYGKYVITTPVLSVMTTAYELFPQKFTDTMNIPESGNGVPDILDEMKWEIDWLRNMQASDGGVFDRVVTTPWATTLPEYDRATRYIAPKTTHTTAIYAANLAAAYRVFKGNARFEVLYPGYADDLLSRAKKAWGFLEAHPDAAPAGGFSNPPGIGGGTYLDPEGDGDNRAWAAAELYKSTGEIAYDTAFRKHMKLDSANYGYNDFNQHWKKASWAYATTKYPVAKEYVDEYKKQVRNSVYESSTSGLAHNTANNPYRTGARLDVPEWIGWGTLAKSSSYAWDLIKASYLLDDRSLIDLAQINLDAQLGANPQYKSYITGVGVDYPRDPLHTISEMDGIEEPVPGIPVYGPFNSLSDSNPYKAAIQSPNNLYPKGHDPRDPYPILRRYWDISEVPETSEFGLIDSANGLVAFAYFSSGNTRYGSGASNPAPVSHTPTIVLATPSGGSSSSQTQSSSGSSASPSQSAAPSGSAPRQTSTNTIPVRSIVLMRDLSVGSIGSDVALLQKFLNNRGFLIASEGPGSPGNETDMFGGFTRAAVMRFQQAHGIYPTGSVGPITRAKINSLGQPFVETNTNATTSVVSSASFTRNLGLGSTGSDVKVLQEYLNKKGFIVSAVGPGSRGQETTTFGPATTRALAKFQERYGITPAAGYLGPLTRAKIIELK